MFETYAHVDSFSNMLVKPISKYDEEVFSVY